jgi:hypothetical protein
MTIILCVLGEGSSDDSIVILSENKIPVNRRCFLPPWPPLKSVSSLIRRQADEGSPRSEQIPESIIPNKDVNKEKV